VARRGSFDVNGVYYEWWDVNANVLGWFDLSLVPGQLEEPSPPASLFTDDRYVIVQGGNSGFEEFVAAPVTFALEEPSGFAPVIAPDAVVTLSPPEDFAGSLAFEEPPGFTPLVVLEGVVFLPPPEDFAGALPLEEVAAFVLPFDTLISAQLGDQSEEFGLPHPNEDTSAAPSFAPDPFIAPAIVSEDFAGSLAFEEPPGFTPLVVIEGVVFLPPSEDFAGSLAFEEPPGFFPRVILDAIVTLSPPEDFAGSLAFEEPPGFTPLVVIEDVVFLPPPEDFAGSLALEEPSGFTPLVILDALVPLPTPEDFAGSLAFEEPPGFVPVPETLLLIPSFPPSEDFAGSFMFEEGPPVLPPFPLEAFTVFVVDEEFIVVPTPPPPPPPPPPIPSITPRRKAAGGGGARPLESIPWCVPWWWPLRTNEPVCPPERTPPEPVALLRAREERAARARDEIEYALLPLDAVEVRALAAGTVHRFQDKRAGKGLTLHADDGTTYHYAELGAYAVPDGARVAQGDRLAWTARAASALPPAPATATSGAMGAVTPTPAIPSRAVYGVLPWVRTTVPPSPPPAPPALPAPAPEAPTTVRIVLPPAPMAVVGAVTLTVLVLGVGFWLLTRVPSPPPVPDDD